MGTPYMAEIRMASFNFAPKGWALCNGQLLPINQNQALFSLLGTSYGGNGQTTFALPDLRGRVPIHVGQGLNQGVVVGEEAHVLTQAEMPVHNHFIKAIAADAPALAVGRKADNTKYLAEAHAVISASSNSPVSLYGTGAPSLSFHPSAIGNMGGSQAHNNQQPFLVITFIIALQGAFPSRN
jgi:microcystin-dependent protein